MKQTLLCTALGLASLGAAAQELVAPVVSSIPVVQQVQVPRQVCGQPMMEEPQTSGGGAILGAILGGLVGSQIGGGSGRTAGLAVGTVGGALIGNSVESSNRQAQGATHCTTETTLENRTVGYNVTYEYGGRQYTVQMPQDPGPSVRLQVSPMGVSSTSAPPQPYAGLPGGPVVMAPPHHSQPMYGAPAYGSPVYGAPHYGPPVYAQPLYPAPYYRSHPPVQLHLGIGYNHSRGRYHHH